MLTKALLLLFCSSPLIAFSQPITWIHGARTAALANSGTALEGPWATSGNPAGMARSSSLALAFDLERRLLLEELDVRAATALFPLRKQVLGLKTSSFGGELSHRSRTTLSSARAFSSYFSSGLEVTHPRLK